MGQKHPYSCSYLSKQSRRQPPLPKHLASPVSLQSVIPSLICKLTASSKLNFFRHSQRSSCRQIYLSHGGEGAGEDTFFFFFKDRNHFRWLLLWPDFTWECSKPISMVPVWELTKLAELISSDIKLLWLIPKLNIAIFSPLYFQIICYMYKLQESVLEIWIKHPTSHKYLVSSLKARGFFWLCGKLAQFWQSFFRRQDYSRDCSLLIFPRSHTPLGEWDKMGKDYWKCHMQLQDRQT